MIIQRITGKIIPLAIIGLLLIGMPSVLGADPIVELSPAEPKPLESVTFTVTIPDVANIEQVSILVQECGNEPNIGYICYTDGVNETMTQSAASSYTATIPLKHENAIELKYQVGYLTENGWTWYPEGSDMVKVELDISSGQSSGNDNDGSDTGSGTPGFEFVGLVVSVIFISLILYKRKR
jgi:hypothetical protein